MKQAFINLVFVATFLVAGTATSQIINVNPDPNGDPWIAGDATITPPEIEASIPFMVLSPASAATELPTEVDNSELIFMPPVFNQGASSACVQVAEIWYSFGYETNRLRNAHAGDSVGDPDHWQNQYHPFYTYNFLNGGNGQSGTFYKSGFRIIMENGCPSFDVYNDSILHIDNDTLGLKYKYWMNEHNNYKSGMHNKISGYVNISWDSSYTSLDTLKHWVSDHNSGDTTGGLAIISVLTSGWITYYAFPPGTPEEGNHYISQWGTSGGHALTIVGYNDSVQCFNLNNDGQYTNDDIDGDGVVELDECELGAFKVVNSWNPATFGDSGYIYVPYKLMAAGLQVNRRAYVCHAIEENTPALSIKTNIEHPSRKKLQYRIGYAEDANALSPAVHNNFRCFAFQGGEYEMRGAYSGPIETGLDFGYWYGNENFGKMYFIVKNNGAVNQYDGTMESFSIMDYRWNQEFELEYPQTNVPINDIGLNTFYINYDLLVPGDNQIIVIDDTLSSNMVSRFEPTVDSNSTMVIKKGVHVDFYNSSLIIKNGSTLIIEDSAVLYGKRGLSSIDILGDLQLGNHVKFVADSACELILNIKNTDTSIYFSVNNTTFENADLHSYCDSLSVSKSNFENGAYLKGYGGNLLVSKCVFDNSFIYALEGQQGNIVEIDSCELHNPIINGSPIFIDSYTHYNIHENKISYSYGTGVSIYNSSGLEGVGTQIIRDNEVYCTGSKKSSFKNTGVKIYNSKTDMLGWNYIHNNDYGVSCLNYSQTKITGDTVTKCTAVSQRIVNNSEHQVYISSASIPTNFNYNEMYETSYSTYFIYELTQIQSPRKFDVTNNFWGENLVGSPSDYIHTSLSPDWSPMCSYKSTSNTIESKYDSAVSYIIAGNYNLAEAKFKEIIEDTLVSNYSYASLNQLFEIKQNNNEDYLGLQNYLDSTNIIQDTTDLGKHARIISNKCDIELENYQTAVDFFEDIILNSGSNQDSIFAIIDLGYLYLKMNNNRTITITSLLPQYIPKSRNKYEIERDMLLDLLYVKNSESSTENEEPINDSDNLISNLVLFPNPTTGIMNIEFILRNAIDLNFTVYDQSGRKIKEMSTIQCFEGSNNQKINLSDLKNGIYYLSIKSNSRSIANRKLVLMK